MIIVGVDPGKKGALALLSGGTLDEVVDMPPDLESKDDLLSAWLIYDDPEIFFVIEQQWPRPEAGIFSANKMGINVGELRGLAQALGYTLRSAVPQKWKRDMGLTVKQIPEGVRPKDASRAKAAELFPEHADLFKRVKDDGRAEAALIAVWFQRYGER